MTERARTARRVSWVAALVPLPALSGCLTAELWSGYAWPEPVVTEQLLDRRTDELAGSVVAVTPVAEHGILWSDEQPGARARWWLRPNPEDRAGVEGAAALFADPDFCVIRSASIDAVRHYTSGELVGDDATLELDLQVRAAAIACVVPSTAIAPAAARALATMQRNAFLPAGDADVDLPAVCQRCAERLAGLDLRSLTGSQSAVWAEAWVFVDAAGRPAFRGRGQVAASPPAEDGGRASLADDLAALRELSLLVRVRSRTESMVLRLRPDRLWLLAGLQFDGDRCLHRSSWFVETAPRSLPTLADLGTTRIASTLRLREESWQRVTWPVLVDGRFLAKVALTPLTLALDVVLGPQAGDFLRWLTAKPPHAAPDGWHDK